MKPASDKQRVKTARKIVRIRVPAASHGQYTNSIASGHAIRSFLSGLSSQKKASFQKFVAFLAKRLPLPPPKSEDRVVSETLDIFSAAGWTAEDTRSTFIKGTDLKPDITLDNGVAYVEALKLKEPPPSADWLEHCRRCVSYARHSSSQIAICTDGRRIFVVSTEEGEPKTAFFDAKRYGTESREFTSIAVMLWSDGPLYQEKLRSDLRDHSELGKKLFKNHILKSVASLPDDYKEYFGLLSACAYAHFNSSEVFFEKNKLLECTYALRREHYDVAVKLLREFIAGIADEDFPGLSSVAKRVLSVVGKDSKKDIAISKAIFLDENERPISWEEFNSDDLSEVFEALSKKKRKQLGIYTTARDLCHEIVKAQIQKYRDNAQGKLALIDPCCGSGSFLDQAVRAVGTELLPIQRGGPSPTKLKSLLFLGQDIEDLGVAITLVNVYVACIRYLWHSTKVKIEILVSTGDTTDARSPLFRRFQKLKPDFSIVFGNPPYLRSRSARFGGVTNQGNLLYKIIEKAFTLCAPGELAFVLPAHVTGGDASRDLDRAVSRFGMKLAELWYLPEIKLFRGVSEKRYLVPFWRVEDRPLGKLLVLTPPKNGKELGIGRSIQRSRNSQSLQFKSDNTRLSEAPLFASFHAPPEFQEAMEKIPTLGDHKKSKYLSIVQGIQEAHPFVPSENDRYSKVIQREGLAEGEPLFVLPPIARREMTHAIRRPLTDLERRHLRRHAKTTPTEARFSYPKSADRVMFTNETFGEFTEEQFQTECPHYYNWLNKFRALLLTDIDRREGRLKWWQLHRTCDPKPTATTRPGLDFAAPKVIASQFLNSEHWAWWDRERHIPAGSSFSAIGPFPGSDSALGLRHNWPEILTGWLNSYSIREVWLKLIKENCKLRGTDGEVQIQHLLKLPVPKELLIETNNKKIEAQIAAISKIASSSSEIRNRRKLIELDRTVWKLFELLSGKSLGSPMTREDGEVELKPTA